MKITITPETDEEKAAYSEEWVRTGVQRFALAGRLDPKEPNFEFGFIHGNWPQVKTEMARLTNDVEAMASKQNIVGAVVEAHNAIARSIQDQALLAQAKNGAKNGSIFVPRIAR